MGGSLGLAMKNARPDLVITGWDTPGALETAQQRGAIDRIATSLEDAVSEADLVVLATPLSATLSMVKALKAAISESTWVHDICSVKQPLAKAFSSAPGHERYLGGHPMTGSEKSGIRHADPVLYENATYVLCPPDGMPRDSSFDAVVALLESTGALLLEMDATVHDRIAAHVSHVPQLLSVLLVNLADQARKTDPEVLRLAAGGFRDMTRIAGSPFPMWEDILDTNRDEITQALSSFRGMLDGLLSDLDAGAYPSIGDRFRTAEQTRDFIPTDGKGFLKPLADVFVFTADRPGALVELTGALFKAELSIKDIELLRIRENRGGTFRLGFETSEEANDAIAVLTETGFTAYRL